MAEIQTSSLVFKLRHTLVCIIIIINLVGTLGWHEIISCRGYFSRFVGFCRGYFLQVFSRGRHFDVNLRER